MTRDYSSNTWMLRVLVLLGVIALQLCMALPRVPKPFIDGRLHTTYDNAALLHRAIHSNDETISEPAKFFGQSRYAYRQGKPSGVYHNGSHGVLGPTCLRIFIGLFGKSEAAMRSFTLCVSVLSTILLFLLIVTEIPRLRLTAVIMTLYVCFPIKYMYVDVWKYESVAEASMLAVVLALRHIERRAGFVAFLALVFLMFHADFMPYLFAVGLVVHLFLRRKKDGNLWVWTTLVGFASVAAAYVIQSRVLGYTRERIAEKLASRTGEHTQHLSELGLTSSLVQTATEGVGETPLVLALFLGVALVASREIFRSSTAYFGVVLFSIQTLWTLMFRSHVFVHPYAHWFYAPAVILILAASLKVCGAKEWLNNRMVNVASISILVLLLINFVDTRVLLLRDESSRFGTASDSAALQKVTGRLLTLPDVPPGWWTSPVQKLYCDPIWRGSAGARITPIEKMGKMRSGDTIAVRNTQAARQQARKFVEKFGLKANRVMLESTSLVFFAVE
ncbi:MAG: hypothetical protein AAF581_02095 [Planctomycetota bacterium]